MDEIFSLLTSRCENQPEIGILTLKIRKEGQGSRSHVLRSRQGYHFHLMPADGTWSRRWPLTQRNIKNHILILHSLRSLRLYGCLDIVNIFHNSSFVRNIDNIERFIFS